MDERQDTPGTTGPGRTPEDPATPAGTEPSAPSSARDAGAKTKPKKTGRGILWAVLAVILAFLAGFGWQYYRAMTLETTLEQTEQDLAVERLRVSLAQATLAAQSGDFEFARQEMSGFFNSAQEQLEGLPTGIQQPLREILMMRDDVITGLSRSNPEYAGVLYGFLDRFRIALEQEPVAPVTEPDTAG